MITIIDQVLFCKDCGKAPRTHGSYCKPCKNARERYWDKQRNADKPPKCMSCDNPRLPYGRRCQACIDAAREKERARSAAWNAAQREKREKIRAEKERREAALKENRVNVSPESKLEGYRQRKAGEGVAILQRKHLGIDQRIEIIARIDDLRT